MKYFAHSMHTDFALQLDLIRRVMWKTDAGDQLNDKFELLPEYFINATEAAKYIARLREYMKSLPILDLRTNRALDAMYKMMTDPDQVYVSFKPITRN